MNTRSTNGAGRRLSSASGERQAMVRAGAGTIAACVLVLASACGSGGSAPVTPLEPTVVSLPPPPQAAQEISVGEEVTGTLEVHGTKMLYQLTAPSDGTLIVRLSWEPHRGLLELGVGDTSFASSPPDWSPPIVGELSVTAGRTYSVKIADGAPWDYDDLYLPYVVTTSMK